MKALFHGSELCEVDADGNVAIPAFLSDALGSDAACQLLVAKHEADACLIGYGREHLAILAERNERRRLADEARGEDARSHYHRMRRSFALTDRLPRDSARLTISATMRHLGRIGRHALFVGAGDSFEIWNPELALQSGDQEFRDLAAYRMGALGAEGVH
jgi:DNA-binding transcriptional regulator/RsmH inhibitor MraZ